MIYDVYIKDNIEKKRIYSAQSLLLVSISNSTYIHISYSMRALWAWSVIDRWQKPQMHANQPRAAHTTNGSNFNDYILYICLSLCPVCISSFLLWWIHCCSLFQSQIIINFRHEIARWHFVFCHFHSSLVFRLMRAYSAT